MCICVFLVFFLHWVAGSLLPAPPGKPSSLFQDKQNSEDFPFIPFHLFLDKLGGISALQEPHCVIA